MVYFQRQYASTISIKATYFQISNYCDIDENRKDELSKPIAKWSTQNEMLLWDTLRA